MSLVFYATGSSKQSTESNGSYEVPTILNKQASACYVLVIQIVHKVIPNRRAFLEVLIGLDISIDPALAHLLEITVTRLRA